MTIFLPKELIENKKVNKYALIVYAYLKLLMPLETVDTYYISLDALSFTIYGTAQNNPKRRQNIWDALCCLYNLGYFNGIKLDGKSSFLIETQSLRIDTQVQKFIIIHSDDMFKIMRSDEKIKAALFSYYIFLMSTINSQIEVYLESGKHQKNIIGSQTIAQLAYLFDVSPHTIIRYNKNLEDLNIIYIHHSDDVFINGKNNLRKMTNIYGRYANQEYIEKYANDYKAHFQSHLYLRKERTLANNDRRLSKMYYWLCKGKDYSESEIQEIYDYITNLNRKYENLSVKEQDDSYLAKIKDEKIFEKFGFLRTE